MNLKRLLILSLASAIAVGCSNGSSDGAATAEDKKNLDNLIQNGVGNHKPPEGAAKPEGSAAPAGVPASGKVDPP